jgi:hypothetical protein
MEKLSVEELTLVELTEHLPVTLLEFLSNTLILYQTCPYFTVSSLLNLAATSKSFQGLIYHTPGVFRHLDLSTTKGANVEFAPIDRGGNSWRAQRMDEGVTEEDFYAGPLRGIFANLRKKHILKDVQTLILDGQSAPVEVLREIICEDSFSVRILSLLKARNLNESRFRDLIKYAVRPGRKEGTPKLKGVYYFGSQQKYLFPDAADTYATILPSTGVTTSVGAQLGSQLNQRSLKVLAEEMQDVGDPWYRASGQVTSNAHHMPAWVSMLQACEGIIAFDAVLCRSPRHTMPPGEATPENMKHYVWPGVATIALGPEACQICHSLPEGPAFPGRSPLSHLPLLAPPPLHSSSVKTAQLIPSAHGAALNIPLYVRCKECAADRWCEGCDKFWCESCYEGETNSTWTQMQKVEAMEREKSVGLKMGIKVHLGLCVEDCLVGEMYNGAGSGGMWV